MQFINITAGLPDKIAAALRAGELVRTGGVIRVAPGFPGGGQIAYHLRDAIPFDKIAQMVPSPGPLLALSQVAAAASVLNLGVSVVGFAVMNHKLNKLQQSVTSLTQDVRRLGTEMSNRLDQIDADLVELRYLAIAHSASLDEALRGIARIEQDLYFVQMATALAWAHRLRNAPRDAREAAHHFHTVRVWAELGLDANAPDAARPQDWTGWFMRYRLWCMVSMLEVAALRATGEAGDAVEVSASLSARARTQAGRWSQLLLPSTEFAGAGRFAFRRLAETVPAEVSQRLLRMDDGIPDSRMERLEVEREGAFRVAEAAPRLSEQWFEQQRRAATMLDFVEETTERVESMGEEMQMCRRRRMDFESWEALPTDGPGLYLVEA